MTLMPVFAISEEWCSRNRKWKRICDIMNSDDLLLGFDEIPARRREEWIRHYNVDAETAERIWLEFERRPHRHRFGFIGEDGEFYANICLLPTNMNFMMVFQVGGKPGIYYEGGRSERSRGNARGLKELSWA